jgi:hypothetical protein
MAALETQAEAAEHNPRGTSSSWPNATADERPRLLRDAATWRTGSVRSVERVAATLREAGFSEAEVAEATRPYRESDSGPWPQPEDRGAAVLSPLGDVEYVEDLIRPGRIVVVAAEEGAGKSYAITGELGIRVAVAGGSFAGTWPILRIGPVLVLSEMHTDDDYAREEAILAALDLGRADLTGRYYRLPLMRAAGGAPALTVAPWRSWVTGWLRDRGALVLIVDTATGATQVDPWGQAIQAVYASLRTMLDEYPELAIILVLHLKKPTGRGERRISDVLGEWGRWNDVTLLMEHDGSRTKITSRKRIRHERRIAATKRDGLLVDPIDLDEAKGTKVAPDAVLAAIEAQPGMGYAELMAAIGVKKDTAIRYVRSLGDRVDAVATGPRGAIRLYPTVAPSHTVAGTQYDGRTTAGTIEGGSTVAPSYPYIGTTVDTTMVAASKDGPAIPWLSPCRDYDSHRNEHRVRGGFALCLVCSPETTA